MHMSHNFSQISAEQTQPVKDTDNLPNSVGWVKIQIQTHSSTSRILMVKVRHLHLTGSSFQTNMGESLPINSEQTNNSFKEAAQLRVRIYMVALVWQTPTLIPNWKIRILVVAVEINFPLLTSSRKLPSNLLKGSLETMERCTLLMGFQIRLKW